MFKLKYRQLSELNSEDYFGEVSLIDKVSRQWSVRCMEECHFAILSKEDFNNALGAIERKKYNEKI